MRIYALIQGWYGQRITLNVERRMPDAWSIRVHEFPGDLPTLIEEPRELMPRRIPRCDLILSLLEHPDLASILPDIAEAAGAEGVIAPIDNSRWMPPGTKQQVSRELERLGVSSAFPKPFCSLVPNSGSRVINEFARYFGRPDLEILVEGGLIRGVNVLRGSPCGCTHFVAERLVGMEKDRAPMEAGLLVHNCPCLASTEWDSEYGDALMHTAGYIIKGAVEKALRDALSRPKR